MTQHGQFNLRSPAALGKHRTMPAQLTVLVGAA
jgi:hypothetical protein